MTKILSKSIDLIVNEAILRLLLSVKLWAWNNIFKLNSEHKLVKLLLSIESFESYDNQILEHAKDVLMKTDFVQNHENN